MLSWAALLVQLYLYSFTGAALLVQLYWGSFIGAALLAYWQLYLVALPALSALSGALSGSFCPSKATI